MITRPYILIFDNLTVVRNLPATGEEQAKNGGETGKKVPCFYPTDDKFLSNCTYIRQESGDLSSSILPADATRRLYLSRYIHTYVSF